MACGIGEMFQISLPQNFNSPYKAKSISEFWERWHMTLTRFFTRYVYIPLGGKKKNRYLNLFIVWALTGLWHGAGSIRISVPYSFAFGGAALADLRLRAGRGTKIMTVPAVIGP